MTDESQRSKDMKLLEKYSMWLEEQGYLDIDWRAEWPFAIDTFFEDVYDT